MQYIQERLQGCASVRAVGGEPIAAAAVGRRPPQDLLGKEQIRMETRWGSAKPQSSRVHFLGPPDQSAQGEARQAWAMCAKDGLGPDILTCLGDAGLPSQQPRVPDRAAQTREAGSLGTFGRIKHTGSLGNYSLSLEKACISTKQKWEHKGKRIKNAPSLSPKN